MASLVEEPRTGDIIQISRSGYSHWAIYVGDGHVIHLAPLEPQDEHNKQDYCRCLQWLSICTASMLVLGIGPPDDAHSHRGTGSP
uniref:LRAT domain-containing protein n=1 Tax=Molossus molossus TaxID=27622 RepID=A0A7J8ETW1_MOLMO|nr:hypothetical protein HJG59_015314 [Molossus molossus]